MLSIQKLNKTYANGIQALRDISLDIGSGIFGLLGPNGAGKSSFMRTLATLQAADSGAVYLNGIDVLSNPHSARQQLGYLPQDFGVYPNVSAAELLNQLAVFKGFTHRAQRQNMVNHQLELVNLYAQRQQKLGTFSGGMRQRFGIAQALLGSPQMVIVDEPTAGLDPTERIRFQNILADISQDRVLILSTHIVEDVADLCPNMAILNKGEIVRQGSPSRLVETLQGQIWQRAIASTDEINPDWRVITSRMARGQRSVRVWSKTRPGEAFTAVDPDLNDVYFTALLKTTETQEKLTAVSV
ncbi:ABC transporter ATP-binding protein [cf. Phormidesmis sp. LEGE 11477]|uniref:ABC transporter ATP-binding protein n=1 Tax=cf. Phormidesmis sp. LEGE 11477 TaxID=1828680 RepID=UPI001880A4B3|nr:ABC transporter ATP-binding protein [cf. Phormidesmis sp. LEGE 11477]MBE9064272.1 ABC transporter ATP-binding protein [cf. Phormidesmis sp. LEGE 11477]